MGGLQGIVMLCTIHLWLKVESLRTDTKKMLNTSVTIFLSLIINLILIFGSTFVGVM